MLKVIAFAGQKLYGSLYSSFYQIVDKWIPHEEEPPEAQVYHRNNIFDDDDIFDDRYIFGFDIIPYVKRGLTSLLSWAYIIAVLILTINIVTNILKLKGFL